MYLVEVLIAERDHTIAVQSTQPRAHASCIRRLILVNEVAAATSRQPIARKAKGNTTQRNTRQILAFPVSVAVSVQNNGNVASGSVCLAMGG